MKDYYVYMYIDPDNGQPFYIGKGCNNRYLDASQKQRNSWLYNKIQKIRSNGYTIKKFTIFIDKNLEEIEALRLEKRLVKEYGRRDLGTGILLNMSDGGDGMIGNRKNRKPTLYEHKDNIFNMYDSGATLDEIALEYKCTKEVVLGLFRFFNKSRRSGGVKPPKLDWMNVKRDFDNGLSISAIRKKYNCDHNTIKNYILSIGYNLEDGRSVSCIRGGTTKSKLDKHKQKIIDLYRSGRSINSISKTYSVDNGTVKRLILKEGIYHG